MDFDQLLIGPRGGSMVSSLRDKVVALSRVCLEAQRVMAWFLWWRDGILLNGFASMDGAFLAMVARAKLIKFL